MVISELDFKTKIMVQPCKVTSLPDTDLWHRLIEISNSLIRQVPDTYRITRNTFTIIVNS